MAATNSRGDLVRRGTMDWLCSTSPSSDKDCHCVWATSAKCPCGRECLAPGQQLFPFLHVVERRPARLRPPGSSSALASPNSACSGALRAESLFRLSGQAGQRSSQIASTTGRPFEVIQVGGETFPQACGGLAQVVQGGQRWLHVVLKLLAQSEYGAPMLQIVGGVEALIRFGGDGQLRLDLAFAQPGSGPERLFGLLPHAMQLGDVELIRFAIKADSSAW